MRSSCLQEALQKVLFRCTQNTTRRSDTTGIDIPATALASTYGDFDANSVVAKSSGALDKHTIQGQRSEFRDRGGKFTSLTLSLMTGPCRGAMVATAHPTASSVSASESKTKAKEVRRKQGKRNESKESETKARGVKRKQRK
jgi:hypothetical protein